MLAKASSTNAKLQEKSTEKLSNMAEKSPSKPLSNQPVQKNSILALLGNKGSNEGKSSNPL